MKPFFICHQTLPISPSYYNPAVQKAFLIYNPASGRRRAKRTQDIARVVEVLRAAGVTQLGCMKKPCLFLVCVAN